MTEKILFQGAEAKIILKHDRIIKRRDKKSYRIKELDEKIRKIRTRTEARLFEKASKIIPVPKLIRVNEKTKEIIMDFVKGRKLSDNLDRFQKKGQGEIAKKIGESAAKLHDSGIVHGDLTTSNMIFNEDENKVYFLDFGLGFSSQRIEDKAVDLHLLREAFESRHFKNWRFLFDKAIEGYRLSKKSADVLERLKAVESRGRYKERY